MIVSPEIQSMFVIAVIVIACISIAYSAFGGASKGVPMLASLQQSNGMWLIGALVVAALLIGTIGACCPSVLPLAQISHPSSVPNGTNEVMSEHFSVTALDNEANILSPFTDTSNKTHAIAVPFALVNQIDNPLNQTYVLRQLPKTEPCTTHSCRLRFSEFEPGTSYTLRVWIRMGQEMKDMVETGQLRSFDLRYVTSGYDEDYKNIDTDQHLSIVDSRTMGEHMWYLLKKNTPIQVPHDASHIEWYVGTMASDVQLSAPVYWCGFHAAVHLEGADFLPVKHGLTSLHSAFEQQSSVNTLGEWIDLSRTGINAKLSHVDSTFTITDDGGLSFVGPLTGTSSRMLSHNPRQLQENQDNIGVFTITFVYVRDNTSSDAVGVQRMLRVRGEHLDNDSLANPPNYLLDIHIDHDTDELQISQQHYKGNAWEPVAFRVKLHADVAVYTLVHDGSKGIRLYSNSTEVAKQDDWFDRSYRVHNPMHSLIWNEEGKTMATLYATLTYNVALKHKQIRKLSKYLMRKYNTVGERPDSVVYGQGTQFTTNHTMELNELRAQMKSLQQKLYLAENTSAFSPEPDFYDAINQAGGSYDAFGTPTDHTSMQKYMERIQSIQGQLRHLREQETMLQKKMASQHSSSNPLTKGTRVFMVDDNKEAIVSSDEYTEQNVPHLFVDYVDGSVYNKKVKRCEVRLTQRPSMLSKPCNQYMSCGSGQFCNYDRLDLPGQGMCEACDSITSCERSFLVDTKLSCEAQCPSKKEPSVAAKEVLCDAKTPCEQNAFCNYVHGDYGYCESCDIVADDLCDSEGMSKEAKRQCRKRCLAKEQKPYMYRSELTDDEYKQLSPEEKKNVLHDSMWNRSVRKFEPLDE